MKFSQKKSDYLPNSFKGLVIRMETSYILSEDTTHFEWRHHTF